MRSGTGKSVGERGKSREDGGRRSESVDRGREMKEESERDRGIAW